MRLRKGMKKKELRNQEETRKGMFFELIPARAWVF